ncbi:MAG: yegT, partial [Phycisphaerales bacterium]|nr:yegT [Phycisphaerales bacterium]
MSDTALNAQLASRLTSTQIQVRLSVMMFLQFFIWGAWYVSMGPFMAEHGMGAVIGRAYTLAPFAAIISPFFLGMIADRFFPSQRVLGVMHLLGAVAMLAIPAVIPATIPNPAPNAAPLPAPGSSAAPFLALIFVHSLFYMPTINLTNSVAFANLTNQEKQFPYIRVFGTLGWIVAGLLVSFLHVDVAVGQFQIAAGAGIALALFSFFLPHPPPPPPGQ